MRFTHDVRDSIAISWRIRADAEALRKLNVELESKLREKGHLL